MKKVLLLVVLFFMSCATSGKVRVLESYPENAPKWAKENIYSWKSSNLIYFVGNSEGNLSRETSFSKAKLNAEQNMIESIKITFNSNVDSVVEQVVEESAYLKDNTSLISTFENEIHGSVKSISLHGVTTVYSYERKLSSRIKGKKRITWSSSVVVSIGKEELKNILYNVNKEMNQKYRDEAINLCDKMIEILTTDKK